MSSNKRIGMAINYDYPDYGGMLQAYASFRKIRDLGYDPEAINIDAISGEIKQRKIKYFIRNIFDISIVKEKSQIVFKKIRQKANKALGDNLNLRYEAFDKFHKEKFKVSREYSSWSDLTNGCKEYSSVVVGSDQLWLPSNIAGDYYTLSFVPNEVNKVAYATSFGVSKIAKGQEEKARQYLNRINFLSAREESGQRIIKECTGRDVQLVCDPALLLTAKEWDEDATPGRIIKDKYSFTINGYEIIIESTTDEEDIKLNVLKKEDFENAITNVVKAFVSSDELDKFLSGEDVNITGVGKKIEDLYIKENIKIRESFIPSNETILLNEKEITKYLLFGNDINEKYYTVKAGDTIESIAEANKLAVEELLVVNQGLNSKNNILSIGQEVSVALISPIVTVVNEEHSVEEKVINYTTQIVYDSSLPWGTTKIKQEGKNGSQIVTQKLKYENGEIVNALIAKTEVVDEVINSIKVVGTMSAVTINPSDIPDSGDWYWPTLRPYIITSPYGWRWGTLHDATDISGTGHGSPIFAANNGVVTKAWYDGIGGNQVIIAHSNDYYTWYAHMSATLVKAGQTVTRGQRIGSMGCTGSACTGTHLHFAAYKGNPGAGGVSFNSMNLYR